MGERGRDHQQWTLNWDPEGPEAVAGLRETTRAWRRTSALPLRPSPTARPLPRHQHFPAGLRKQPQTVGAKPAGTWRCRPGSDPHVTLSP